MRIQTIVLLAAATLLASVNSSPTPTDVSAPTTSSLVVSSNTIHSNRLSRTGGDNDAETEDRLYMNLPGIETATNYVKSFFTTQQAQVEAWLQNGKSADDVFNLLKLDTAGDNLLQSPKLETWITYMNALNAKKPVKEVTMLDTFTAAYGDAALAKILQSAKEVDATKTLATKLQLEQFGRWLDEKQPITIYNMFELKPNTWRQDPAAKILHEYNQFYKTNIHKGYGIV